MQRLKQELALAELPTPVALTPEQLMAVAAGTAVALKVSLGEILGPVITSGALPGPVLIPTVRL